MAVPQQSEPVGAAAPETVFPRAGPGTPAASARFRVVSAELDLPTDKNTPAGIANNNAVNLAESGRLEEALGEYNKALEFNPNLAATYNNRGNLMLRLGRLEEALADYREALFRVPGSSLFRYNFGSALLDAERYEEAVVEFEKARLAGPAHANVLLNLGMALSGAGRHDDAIAAYKDALLQDGNLLSAQHNLGNAYANLERWDEAVQAYNSALAINNQISSAYEGRGNAHLQQERYEDALKDFDRALILDPKSGYAHFRRGLALERLERPAEALGAFERAVEANAEDAFALLNRSILLVRLERFDEAVDASLKALSLNPELGQGIENLATAYLNLGRSADAIELYRRAMKTRADDAALRFNLGLALSRSGLFQDASAAFKEAERLGLHTAAVYIADGFALAQLQEWDAALACYRRAAVEAPADPVTFQNIAYLYGALGQHDEAILALEQAVAVEPSSLPLRGELSKALVAAGRVEEIKIKLAAWSQAEIPKDFQNGKYIGINDVEDTNIFKTTDHDARMQKEESRSESLDPLQLALAEAAQAPMPLDVVTISSRFGVDVYFAEWDITRVVMGETIADGERRAILVNEQLRTEWVRSTIAEQLYWALTLRGSADEVATQSASGSDPTDEQAQRFADSLLMPDERVYELADLVRDHNALAAAFDVPRSMVERRLQQLGIVEEGGSHARPTRDVGRTIGPPQTINRGSGGMASQQFG